MATHRVSRESFQTEESYQDELHEIQILSPSESKSIQREIKTILRLAVLSMGTNILTASMSVVDLLMVGHLGTDELAAASIATTYFSIFYSFMIGVSFAFESIGSQVYGARDFISLNHIFRQGFVVSSVFLIIESAALCLVGYFSKYVLLLDDDISDMIAHFEWLLIPGLWTFSFYQILTKYLQVQNNMKAPLFINFLGNLINVGLNYTLIYVYDLGLTGAPLATTLSRTFMCISLLICIFWIQSDPQYSSSKSSSSSIITNSNSTTLNQKSNEKKLDIQEEEQQQVKEEGRGEEGGREKINNNEIGIGFNERIKIEEEEREERTKLILSVSYESVSSTGSSWSRRRYRGGSSGGGSRSDILMEKEKLFIMSKYHWKKAVTDVTSLWPLFKFTFSGGIMTSIEIISYQITNFEASYISTIDVAAQQICNTIEGFTYLSFPLGLAIAGSIRVGNLIGAYRPKQAKRSGIILVFLGILVMCVLVSVYLTTRKYLGLAFTSDQEVVDLVSKLLIVISVYQLLDGIHVTTAAILRGLARLDIVAKVDFIAFWVIAVPVGALLTFVFDWSTAGLWWGFVFGLVFADVVFIYMLSQVDWKEEAKKARMITRSQIDNEEKDDDDDIDEAVHSETSSLIEK